jgi:sugar phosphate isomerase/epimerase
MTIHLGLGRLDYEDLSWERSVKRLGDLVRYGEDLGVCVCLENLASGWSSRPELVEKLVRKSKAAVTLDIGHARVNTTNKYATMDLEMKRAAIEKAKPLTDGAPSRGEWKQNHDLQAWLESL